MIGVIVVDATAPWEPKAYAKIISLQYLLCNCNCNLARIAISAATYRGAKCPTLKTAGKQPKGVPGGTAKKQPKEQPEEQPKHPKNSCFTCFCGVSAVLPNVFRLFTVTHSAPFSAVFRLFSMSGTWHLCGWPQRLQGKKELAKPFFST